MEEICRKLGVFEPTFYWWKKQFAGMGTVEIRRLKQLEEENAKLKRLVANLSLDQTMLQDVLQKMVGPGVRHGVVGVLQGVYQVSDRQACSAMGFRRSSQRYRSRRDPQVALRMRLKDLAAVRVRYGYRYLHISRGKPRSLRVDNGPEFAGWLLDHGAYPNKVEIDFSRPSKPTDNAFIEAFDARLRAECLNASWFPSPADARDRIEERGQHYNNERPHSALRNSTPRALPTKVDET